MSRAGGEGGPIGQVVQRLGSATLHEAAGKAGALPSSLINRTPPAVLAGQAYPARCPPGDNLWLHHAIYRAGPGDVLVVDVGEGAEFGYWGELLSLAAVSQGLGGLVITGGVRDVARLRGIGFPVYSACLSIRGTTKRPELQGSLGKPVTIGQVVVSAGDLVVGDDDGLVVIARDRVGEVLRAALRREADELQIAQQLRFGRRTLDLLNLPALPGLATGT